MGPDISPTDLLMDDDIVDSTLFERRGEALMGSGFEPKFYQSATVTQFNVLEFGPHECLLPPLGNALSTRL